MTLPGFLRCGQSGRRRLSRPSGTGGVDSAGYWRGGRLGREQACFFFLFFFVCLASFAAGLLACFGVGFAGFGSAVSGLDFSDGLAFPSAFAGAIGAAGTGAATTA